MAKLVGLSLTWSETQKSGFLFQLSVKLMEVDDKEKITLRLHYVTGDHGSHGSPKHSAPCDLVNFCLGTQVLLSIITFWHGLLR